MRKDLMRQPQTGHRIRGYCPYLRRYAMFCGSSPVDAEAWKARHGKHGAQPESPWGPVQAAGSLQWGK